MRRSINRRRAQLEVVQSSVLDRISLSGSRMKRGQPGGRAGGRHAVARQEGLAKTGPRRTVGRTQRSLFINNEDDEHFRGRGAHVTGVVRHARRNDKRLSSAEALRPPLLLDNHLASSDVAHHLTGVRMPTSGRRGSKAIHGANRLTTRELRDRLLPECSVRLSSIEHQRERRFPQPR